MIETFSIVVAHDQNNGIGQNGQLPWHLPGDMAYFKTLTSNTQDPTKQNAVIMGRKTFESIPEKYRPLPNRLNIVLTQNPSPKFPNGVRHFHSLNSALSHLLELEQSGKIEQVFCIGGGQLYQDSIYHPSCQQLYITQINAEFNCDTHFPDYTHRFTQVWKSPPKIENNTPYQFTRFELIP